MSYKANHFIQDLDKVAKARQDFAGYLNEMANTLTESEAVSGEASGRLGLQPIIQDLSTASHNLSQDVFRLLVLGDMKRGKSTFLNALMGESLLPTDVNPCTAVLTVLRYGTEKTVTVYFRDQRPPKTLTFAAFKQQYTINPEQAKTLAEQNIQAFPEVEYAVVEYPLAILEKGVEIVDSPGLNDTEARNEITLNYLNNCHAVLFVLSATQQFTLSEQRYLDNYIKDRGLTVFFLINAWDEIQRRLIDPDDQNELQEAEARVRRVFQSNLADYCHLDGDDRYDDRVFEISSLNELRSRLKQAKASDSTAAAEMEPTDTEADQTGFEPFLKALNQFLTKERAIAELRQAKILARHAYRTTHDAIERRIPLLSHDLEDLRVKIRSVQPEFEQLFEIRESFKDEIHRTGELKAGAISASFRAYLMGLGETFEEDFVRYQPELRFFEFLQRNKREEFQDALKQAFEQYLNDKVAAWSLTAQKDIDTAFMELANSAYRHGESYTRLTDRITEKLTGQKMLPPTELVEEDNSPGWAKWAVGLYALSTGDVGAIAMASSGLFNWKQILMNLIGATFATAFFFLLTDIVLGPIGIALAGLGLGSISTEQARRKVLKTMKQELTKLLPQVAQSQSLMVYQTVKECFDAYQHEVVKRVNEDIMARKLELSELIQQKQQHEVDRDAETERFNTLDKTVLSQLHQVEDTYDQWLGYDVAPTLSTTVAPSDAANPAPIEVKAETVTTDGTIATGTLATAGV